METVRTSDSSEPFADAPRVEFAGDVLQQIRQHARSSMRAEICGVLIGHAADTVTRVTARIAGEGASQGGAHVTFTQDTWEHIYKVKDAEFPSQAIVGWYHSHPGFGIFLSDYDLFIHENFFQASHQIAWVFDPHSDEEGCFGWIGGKVEPLQQVTVARKHRPPAPEQAQEEAASREAAPPREPSMATTIEAPRRSTRIAMATTVAIVAFAGGVLLRPYVLPLMRLVLPTRAVPTRPHAPPGPVAANPSQRLENSKSGPAHPSDLRIIPAPEISSADPSPALPKPDAPSPAPSREVSPAGKPPEGSTAPGAERRAEPNAEGSVPTDPPAAALCTVV